MKRFVGKSRTIVIWFRRAAMAAFIVLCAGIMHTASAAELIMFEQEACPWCERWNEEVGEAYSNSEEGNRAPLRRVDIHETMPQDLQSIRAESFTPTFVLVDNGHEIGRIRGYPGADFFWWMLDEIMQKLDKKQNANFLPMQ